MHPNPHRIKILNQTPTNIWLNDFCISHQDFGIVLLDIWPPCIAEIGWVDVIDHCICLNNRGKTWKTSIESYFCPFFNHSKTSFVFLCSLKKVIQKPPRIKLTVNHWNTKVRVLIKRKHQLQNTVYIVWHLRLPTTMSQVPAVKPFLFCHGDKSIESRWGFNTFKHCSVSQVQLYTTHKTNFDWLKRSIWISDGAN